LMPVDIWWRIVASDLVTGVFVSSSSIHRRARQVQYRPSANESEIGSPSRWIGQGSRLIKTASPRPEKSLLGTAHSNSSASPRAIPQARPTAILASPCCMVHGAGFGHFHPPSQLKSLARSKQPDAPRCTSKVATVGFSSSCRSFNLVGRKKILPF
jgi:hypothetical protein